AASHPSSPSPQCTLATIPPLLASPPLLEPRLPLRGEGWLMQTRLWSMGYVVLLVLIALCAFNLWRRGPVAPRAEPESPEKPPEPPPSAAQYLRWIVLAFVPSSLMIGATTYITTDIAAVPLLWVMPLAIYLLTFILAFGRWPSLLHRLVVALTVPAVLVVMFLIISALKQRIWVTVLWHFLLLFLVA